MSTVSGIELDYITKGTNRNLTPEEKCTMAIDGVGQGRILIFEGGLNPTEEALLISQTMESIDHVQFFGLEIYSERKPTSERSGFFKRNDEKVTVVAPAQTQMRFSTL